MSSLPATDSQVAHGTAASGAESDPVELRIGRAWRELTRGAGLQALRRHLFDPLLEAAQIDALDVLANRGPQRMSDFADALGVDASTATRTVTRLEDGGYVRRARSAGDGRGVQVELTDTGVDTVAEVVARRRRLLESSLDGLDETERQMLAALLERFVAGVQEYASETNRGRPASAHGA
jgi:DNA-binding MarR family transcriptional regulator